MQTVLVDIYNYCHRNKQLARQNLSRGSSISSNDTNVMVRQVSTDSNNEYECIVTGDVFHPEGAKQTITPFSPVYTDPNQVAMKFPLQFKEVGETKPMAKSGSINVQPGNQTPKTEQELISAISSSPPSIPKDPGVHILNKPPSSSSERRANRFSVTKIFDSLVSHATGVSNKLASVSLENKSKKQAAAIPKDEMSKSMNNDGISNIKSNTAPAETVTTSQLVQTNNKPEPSKGLSLDCSGLLSNGNETCINSPIEIIEVDEGRHILDDVSDIKVPKVKGGDETIKSENDTLVNSTYAASGKETTVQNSAHKLEDNEDIIEPTLELSKCLVS